MAGRDNPSPASSLTPSTSSSANKSLSRTLSSASSTYNTKFLSVFKPPTKKPSLEPILIPGLDGILSNSGVAKVFDLDPRKPKQKGLTRVLKKFSGYKKDEDEDKDKERLNVRVRAIGDKLPKHSNVFTGMPTPDASAINSVYPSSTSGETSAEEGEEEGGVQEDMSTTTLSTPIPMPNTPTTPDRPRRERRKSVSFSLSGDHGSLARMPSVHEPCPEMWPGATPEEVERVFFGLWPEEAVAEENGPPPPPPSPPVREEEEEGEGKWRYREETFTYTVRVPGKLKEGEQEHVHIFLPPVTRRRGRRGRMALPKELCGECDGVEEGV
ncbi:hypothetical protein BDD12DRAFT_908700 [Trichophaea hybrida]|nr:hypothetical protein BDD12DRAFT_908700 [Trichophaea hybrida]